MNLLAAPRLSLCRKAARGITRELPNGKVVSQSVTIGTLRNRGRRAAFGRLVKCRGGGAGSCLAVQMNEMDLAELALIALIALLALVVAASVALRVSRRR